MPEEPTKNDGTDPKKTDGTTEGSGVTTLSCFMQLYNYLPDEITKATLTHVYGQHKEVIALDKLKARDITDPLQISFEVGLFANYDYWNASFELDGKVYRTFHKDFCNITAEDTGGYLICAIKIDDGTMELHVDMPKSTGCNFVIKKD